MNKTKSGIRGWVRVLIIILPYFLIVGIFQYIGSLIAKVDIINIEAARNQTSIQLLIISFFGLIGTLLVIWMFTTPMYNEKFINLGFRIRNRFKDLVSGIGIGFIVMAIGYLLLLFLKEITFVKINFDSKEIIIAIALFIIVAVTEEVLLRGYVLNNLMLSFNKYVALIVSSILFSLMHGFNPDIGLLSFFNLFLAGILLGLSYIHTKNLWFPIALHFSWNLFQALFGFKVSGHAAYSIIEFKINEANIFNGGDFGFEGSILCVIAQVVAIIAIETYFRRKKQSTTQITQSMDF